MDANELLNQVENMITAKRPAPGGTYFLYVQDRKICLTPKKDVPDGVNRITFITSCDINNGLLSGTWGYIKGRLRKLLKEGKLRTQPPKL